MSLRKKLITLAVILGIAAGLFGAAEILRSKYVAPILMYHMVRPHAPPQDRLVVSTRTFERQMRFLRTHRYTVVSLETLAGLLKNKKKVPARTIAITFDDGYRDTFTEAYPILKKYGIPATVFIIVREVGRERGDRLTWGEIEAMRDSGLVTIGSHAIGPDPLIKIKDEEALRREIFDSKKILEEKLKMAVLIFSYPEGMFTPHIRQLVVEAGYAAAVATNPGRGYLSRDVFALKRLRISENCQNMFVFWVESSGYYTWIKESRRKHKK